MAPNQSVYFTRCRLRKKIYENIIQNVIPISFSLSGLSLIMIQMRRWCFEVGETNDLSCEECTLQKILVDIPEQMVLII